MPKLTKRAGSRTGSKSKMDLKRTQEFVYHDNPGTPVEGKINDVSWYAHDAQLLKDASSLSFFQPLGLPVNGSFINDTIIAGVMNILFVPTVGEIQITSIPSSAINIAARRLYSEVRHANSGSRNYEPADLMQYILAIDGLVMFRALLKRTYSLLLDYQMTNRYMSKPLLESQHLDVADLINHIADLRYYINKFTSRLNIFALPKGFPFITRHEWMCNSIFMDAPMRKGQFYIFTPASIPDFDWANAKIQNLVFKDANNKFSPFDALLAVNEYSNSTAITFSQLVTWGESLMNNLSSLQDVGIISGDIVKCYGDSGIVTFDGIPTDYHVEPIFSVEVLNQIHNATILREYIYSNRGTVYTLEALVSASHRFNIEQNANGQLQYESANGDLAIKMPYLTDGNGAADKYTDIIFDLTVDPVEPAQTMVASRLTCGFEILEHIDKSYYQLVHLCGFGTEVCLASSVYRTNVTSGEWTQYSTFVLNQVSGRTATAVLDWVYPFDYLPRGLSFILQATGSPIDNEWFMYNSVQYGTINNYVTLNVTELRKMSECAVISEFAVPSAYSGTKKY